MPETDKEVKSGRFIADILRDLDEAAATGLDMSPGDSLCGEAAAAIRELLGNKDALSEAVSRCEFERGCREYQDKLYGKQSVWRPIAEIHEDYGPCVLMNTDDPAYMEIGSNLDIGFDESRWTHFAQISVLGFPGDGLLDDSECTCYKDSNGTRKCPVHSGKNR